ncbi:MAG: hypothetical protein WD397_06300 [Wenzhouxiangellaceae bacterium]
MTRLVAAIGLIAFSLSACSRLSDDQTIPVDLTGGEERVISELEARDIWYRRVGAGMIEVKMSDTQQVIEILDDSFYALLPPGRSSSFNAKVHPILKKRLEERGITFKTVCFDNSEFLVWESGQSMEVEAIAHEVFEGLAEQGALDSDTRIAQVAGCP